MYSPELKRRAIDMFLEGYTCKEISLELDMAKRTVERTVQGLVRPRHAVRLPKLNIEKKTYLWQLPEEQKPAKRIVGVIGDLHAPFIKKGYIEWLVKTFDKWGVTDIVNIGDSVDQSTLTHHTVEADAYGTVDEFGLAKAQLKQLYEIFPTCYCCLGNHSVRLERKATDSGIPTYCLKSLKSLYDIPEGWKLAESWDLYGVKYIHGTQFNSRNILTSIANYDSRSVVMGHQHSLLGVVYTRNLFDRDSFAMGVGCGIDEKAYAFRYGKNNKFRPILGCGIVISDDEAYCIRMD